MLHTQSHGHADLSDIPTAISETGLNGSRPSFGCFKQAQKDFDARGADAEIRPLCYRGFPWRTRLP